MFLYGPACISTGPNPSLLLATSIDVASNTRLEARCQNLPRRRLLFRLWRHKSYLGLGDVITEIEAKHLFEGLGGNCCDVTSRIAVALDKTSDVANGAELGGDVDDDGANR